VKGSANSLAEDGVSHYLFEGIFDANNINNTSLVLRDTVKYLVNPREGTKTEITRYPGYQEI
jgi:hypothetical protein